MLPTEVPPDPSCSSKSLAVKTDEKVNEKFVSLEADPVVLEEIPTPNFCIRDYVFASRSKDIKACWPFTLEALQLHVKNGITNLLPPFEPPDLVRAQCPLITCSVEQRLVRADVLNAGGSDCFHEQPASIEKDSGWSPENLALDASDQDKVDQGTSLDKKPHLLSSDSDDNERIHKTKKLPEALEKKSKLVARLGAIPYTNHLEDMVSNSITVSDLMVSKVCPVCKMFSSTSNTTLNAHIDQCLSTESNTNKVLNKFPKNKAKPTKKRLMVDIYTTAPSCTLEDLDRRNGTNWAVELALLVAPNAEVTDTKRPKLSQNEPTNEGSEGAVYIDSNGIKLRILSKFNGASLQDNDLELQKHTKEMNPDTSILIRKRKNISPKYSKRMKSKARAKPLGSSKLLNTKIPTTSDDEENDQQTDESESQLLVATNHVKRSLSSNLRRLTSKYSDASRKQINEVSHVVMERMPCRKDIDGHLDPCHIAVRKHKKLPGPYEDLTSSPETKRVDSMNTAAVNIMIDRKKQSQETSHSNARWSSESTSSANGLLFRFSRPSRNFPSSNSYSKDAMCMNDGSSDVLTKLEPHNLKGRGLVKRSNFHIEANKGKVITETLTVLKNIRKHRSNLRTAKRGIEVWPHIDGGAPGTFKDLRLENDKPLGSCQSALSDNINQEPPNSSNDIQTSEGKEDYNRMQTEECDNSKELPPEGEKLHGHKEISDIGDCPRLFSEKVVDSNAHGNAKNTQTIANTLLHPRLCIEEPEDTLSGREQQLKRSEDLEIHHGDVYPNDIGNNVNQKEDEYEHEKVKESSLDSHDDCHLDVMSGQDSGCCLTSHEDLGLDLPNKSSSITSVCQTENHNTNLRGEKELSGSPVSTTSMVVPLSPRKIKSKDSEGDMLSSTTILEAKPGMVDPTAEISKEETERGFYDGNGENWNLPVNDQILNGKPCCSCRESLSRDPQLPRQSATAETVQGKQVPSLFAGPRILSSFSAYQSRRTNAVSNTSLGSSCPIVSSNNRQDAPMHYAACPHSPSAPSQSQNQSSTSNPVLRLMGKNLMVVNKEELVQTQTVTLEQPPNLNTSSPAFASTSNHFKQEFFPYHHQFVSGSPATSSQAISDHQMPMQFPIIAVGGFAGSSYHSSWINPDYQSPHKRQYKRLNSLPASYSTNEAIVIDDNPEHETELRGCLVSPTNSLPRSTSSLSHLPQRTFSCFPTQSYSREVPDAITPMFQNVYINPRISASFANRGNIQEGQVPYVPNPLVFQSPMRGQIGSSIYYPQTLR